MKRVTCFILIACRLFVDATKFMLNDTDAIKISLLPESESSIQFTDKDKPISRYGFHRTHDCPNFKKAFICIRKCLDLDFQIAHADKDCTCKCYKNKMLSKYKPKMPESGSAKWKLGAPTTKKPQWASGRPDSNFDDYEINANYNDFIVEATESVTEGELNVSLLSENSNFSLDVVMTPEETTSYYEYTTERELSLKGRDEYTTERELSLKEHDEYTTEREFSLKGEESTTEREFSLKGEESTTQEYSNAVFPATLDGRHTTVTEKTEDTLEPQNILPEETTTEV